MNPNDLHGVLAMGGDAFYIWAALAAAAVLMAAELAILAVRNRDLAARTRSR